MNATACLFLGCMRFHLSCGAIYEGFSNLKDLLVFLFFGSTASLVLPLDPVREATLQEGVSPSYMATGRSNFIRDTIENPPTIAGFVPAAHPTYWAPRHRK